MLISFHHNNDLYEADLSKPIDISIPLRPGKETVNCFYAPFMEISPVISGDFIGSTAQGGPLNFLNVRLNPHGNGTHTECVGHIAKEAYSINESLTNFHYIAKVISVKPSLTENGDHIIFKNQIENILTKGEVEAIVIRTLPNIQTKCIAHYSGANPAYVHHEAMDYIVECGIKHLLIDLPSVDREEDGGALLSHHSFWKYPKNTRTDATISELIFVNDKVEDGIYLLNIQIASFDIDVSPSKPVLYYLKQRRKKE